MEVVQLTETTSEDPATDTPPLEYVVTPNLDPTNTADTPTLEYVVTPNVDPTNPADTPFVVNVIKSEEGVEQDEEDTTEVRDWTVQPCHMQDDGEEPISLDLAVSLLMDPDTPVCLLPPVRPTAGYCFLFDESIKDSWMNDGYEWQDAGKKKVDLDDYILTQNTYYIKLSTLRMGSVDFQRVVYRVSTKPNIMLVSYFGNEEVYLKDPKVVLNPFKNALKKRGRGRPRKHELPGLGGEMQAKSMGVEEAMEYLDDYKGRVSKNPPHLPKAGEIYYYDTDAMGETWKYDGYMWRNSGKRNIPKEDPIMEKTFYTIRLDETTYDGCTAFQRIVFRQVSRPNIVVVQYAGDENIWQMAMMSKTSALRPKYRFKSTMEITPEELASPPTPVAVTDDPKREMTYTEAAELLSNHNGRAAKNRPFKPKAGEAYIFYLKAKMKEAYKYDGYDWQMKSPVYYPPIRPKISLKPGWIKTPADPTGSPEFKKSVYCLLDNLTIALVHYHGDEAVAANRKRSADDEDISEVPSTKQKLEEHIMPPDLTEAPEVQPIKTRALRLQEVLDILNNYEDSISYSRAIKPKAGEIYIFDTSIIGDDWKCDNYVWRNSGTSCQPKKNPLIRKVFSSIRLDEKVRAGSKAFQKTQYSLIERPNIVMVHYFGDETIFNPLQHGNRKKGFVEYTRTVPSTMKSIKQALVETSGSTPKTTLKHLNEAYQLGEGEAPRNLDQIRNTKRVLAKRNIMTSSSNTTMFKGEQTGTLFQSESEDNPNMDVLQYVTADEANSIQNELVLMNLEGGGELGNNEVIYVHHPQQSTENLVDTEENQNAVEIILQEEDVLQPEENTISSQDQQIIYSEQQNTIQDQQIIYSEHQNTSQDQQIIYSEQQNTSQDQQIFYSENQNVQVKSENTEEEATLHAEPEQESDSQNESMEISADSADLIQLQDLADDSTAPAETTPDMGASLNSHVISLDKTPETTLRKLLQGMDKSQLVIQALDSRPEVCSAQLALLEQHRLNVELMNRKLMLEIQRMEAGGNVITTHAPAVTTPAPVEATPAPVVTTPAPLTHSFTPAEQVTIEDAMDDNTMDDDVDTTNNSNTILASDTLPHTSIVEASDNMFTTEDGNIVYVQTGRQDFDPNQMEHIVYMSYANNGEPDFPIEEIAEEFVEFEPGQNQ